MLDFERSSSLQDEGNAPPIESALAVVEGLGANWQVVSRPSAALLGGDCVFIVCRWPGHASPGVLREQPRAERALLSLMFTDIVDSTRMAERLGDAAWRALLHRHHTIVREQLSEFRGTEVDKAGDGFFATFDRPGRAVQCAEAIRAALRPIGIEIRSGIHAGECEFAEGQVSGVAVHVAARVAAVAKSGQTLVSSTVRDLLAGSGLKFSSGEWHALKGLSGKRRLFAVSPALATPAGHRHGIAAACSRSLPARDLTPPPQSLRT